MKHRTTVLMTEFVTHDVKRFIVKKPEMFSFAPGQGVELVIDQGKWRKEEGRPFTPTSLVTDEAWSSSSNAIQIIRESQTSCTPLKRVTIC